MAAVLLTKDNRKCQRCNVWKHIDDFSPKRRACRDCRKQDHCDYRARRNPNYNHGPMVPITTGLTKALEIVAEGYGGNARKSCAGIGISRTTYYRVIKGPAYTESGLRTQVKVAAAEKILRAAQEVIADRSPKREQWVSAAEI